jgi:hypothetical protein
MIGSNKACCPNNISVMSRFTTTLSPLKSQAEILTGREKRSEVSRLIETLNDDSKNPKLSTHERDTILEQLRAHGRDPANADPIYSKGGIKTLSHYAFESDAATTSREALRCVANALLLRPNLRQVFVDLDCPNKAAEKLKNQDTDDEFLLCRIFFLLTYETKLDFDALFDDHSLGESINNHIRRHANLFSKPDKTYNPTTIETAALSETLKLLFNLSNFYQHRIATFSPSVEGIFRILAHITIPKPPLEAPINYLVNALVNLELAGSEPSTLIVFPKNDQHCNVHKLINILDEALSSYQPSQLETLAAPIVTVLRKIYDIAPEEARRTMQRQLLPAAKDRDLPVGQSDSLSSRLLRLSTSAVAPSLREGISSLMFELSGKDASQFVRNVGYGFAAGYLMSHDIPIPASARETREDEESGIPINPITGQRLDKEPVGEEPEMTVEEKEREAERLFVLFERLRATGVVDVQNPVRQAMEEGRFDRRIEEVDEPD